MSWRDSLPDVRGKLLRDEPLGPFTWFRVGGNADGLFIPADGDDLADFLKALDPDVPVTVLGVGSNVIVRDGGVEGVVIRLAGRPFAGITTDADTITAGAGALDSMVAKASAKAGLAGLEFYAGIPGTIGGALTMNAGCYGSETKDILVSARGVTRAGERVEYSLGDFGYTYRHSEAPADIIWLEATYRGKPDDPAAVSARIAEITSRREQTQPIREKTGGSTFKNPPGHSSWKLVDEAGWRGRLFKATGGGAKFSELHSNFMINPGEATAADIEGLGEAVRADVLAKSGVQLDWEIKRIGRTADIQLCSGCGSRLVAVDGPIHAYMTSSPACWAAFNTVMAREYSDPVLMAVHRLSVDAWAVQHPGDGSRRAVQSVGLHRRAVQSVGLHLARLMVQLEHGLDREAANAAMLRFAARKAFLPELPPRDGYALTVAGIVEATEPEAHRRAVRDWALATWADWSDQREFIRRWAADS